MTDSLTTRHMLLAVLANTGAQSLYRAIEKSMTPSVWRNVKVRWEGGSETPNVSYEGRHTMRLDLSGLLLESLTGKR
jgi:hypothetical protein